MREVDESIRCYLQEDIQNMSEELRETERLLFKLDENRKNNIVAIHDLEQTKGCYPLLSMQKMRSQRFWLL